MAETMVPTYNVEALDNMMALRGIEPEDSFHAQELEQEQAHWYQAWLDSLFS